MTTKKFVESLAILPSIPGACERNVEDIYNDKFKGDLSGITISNPFNCDGYFECAFDYDLSHNARVLIEYKYNEDMSNPIKRSGVILQTIYYLKKMDNHGWRLPNLVFIGDIDECFILHTNCLLPYLDEPLDWSIPPSDAAAKNKDIVTKIAYDPQIRPFVWTIKDEGFLFKDIIEQIKNLSKTVPQKTRINEHNMERLFEHFDKKILDKKSKAHLNMKDRVLLFIGCLIYPNKYHIDDKRYNILCTPNGDVHVSGSEFRAFFSLYENQYTETDAKRFTEIADRLIEDLDRRKSGDFWTPTTFVDYAHEKIEAAIGEDWKEKYVVWDCCCGTKNITRDYTFKRLYSSTLFQSELDMAKNYNREGTSFQFDFLNDEFKRVSEGGKVPDSLIDALENDEPIAFPINPPYGVVTNKSGLAGSNGNNNTWINSEMKRVDKVKSKELLIQFLWRILDLKRKYNLSNVALAVFTKPSWICIDGYKKFRNLFFHNFSFLDGMMFKASHFSDVSNMWGITFNVWRTGTQLDKNNFKHTLVDLNDEGEVVAIGEKTIYNLDNIPNLITTATYVGSPVSGLEKDVSLPTLNKGVFPSGTYSKLPASSFGYIACMGNMIESNRFTRICSGSTTTAGIYPLCKENIVEACVTFAIRHVPVASWKNDKDSYIIDTTKTIPEQFILDSIMFTTFGNWCVSIVGDDFDIRNQMFWLPRSKIIEWSKAVGYDACHDDASSGQDETIIYEFIKKNKGRFSNEAQALFDKANELVEKTFVNRKLFMLDHEDYQVDRWDAGYYQQKKLWEEFLPDEYKKFKTKYKVLNDKLCSMVYTLGFLRK